jgi:hypothetical protein
LQKIKANAKQNGYDPDRISLANDGVHKLVYETPDGRQVKFGAVKFGDFFLWSSKDKALGERKRKAYLARATKIKGDWAKDKFSPNNLAINILWK